MENKPVSDPNGETTGLRNPEYTLPPNLYLLPVVITPFLLLAPVWLAGKALFWGTVSLQFVPWRFYAWKILSSGHLPLWNDLNGMGAPLFANYQSALLYPPNWLLFILQAIGGIGWMAWGQALLVAAHLAWAGLGMAMLARKLGLKDLAQSVCGLAYGLSGYLVARSSFLSINAAVAWLPWVILAVEGIEEFSQPRNVGAKTGERRENLAPIRSFRGLLRTARLEIWRVRWLAVCLTLLLLAGHAQTAWYTLILAFLWAALRVWMEPGEQTESGNKVDRGGKLIHRLGGMGKAWGRLCLAALLAAALAAIQLAPTAEYLLQSQRAGQVDYEFAMNYSFWPWRFLTLVAPDMFGNPVRGDYWGYGNYWEDAVYIGLLPLILGLGAALRQKSRAKILFGLAVLSFVLALGKNTPIYPWLYRSVPTFAMFQAPTRISIWAIFALALLAGMGVHSWRRPTGRGLYWTRLATAGGLAVTIGAGLGWYLIHDINLTYLRATALAGLWGLGTGLLTLLGPFSEKDPGVSPPYYERFWPWAVILFVAADLIVAGWGLNPGIGVTFYAQEAINRVQERVGLDNGRVMIPPEIETTIKYDRFMRFDSFMPLDDWSQLRRIMLPNLNVLDGQSSANNFDPLVPARYARWMQALDKNLDEPITLNLMAVSVVENMESSLENGVRFTPISSGRRLRWVPCAILVRDEEAAWQMLFSGRFDPDRQVIIEDGGNLVAPDCTEEDRSAGAIIVSDQPNQVLVQVHSQSPGWLVLSDTWYPSWRASLDGEDVPISHADYLFRAVRLEAGNHEVNFSYRPTSLISGSLMSLVAWMVLWVAWKKGR